MGASAGSSWGDYDNDRLIDLFICNWEYGGSGTQNFLYHNEGNGHFSKIESGAIVNETGFFSASAWGDYDNDGYVDLVVPNRGGNVLLFHNTSNGNFEQIYDTLLRDLNEHFRGSSWIDLNKDGYLDLFLTTYGINYLFQNSGRGDFFQIKSTRLSKENKKTGSCSWVDFDNDGDFDVFIPVYPGTNLFYINNGDGTFILDTESKIIDDEYSIGGSWADCNNDGFLDLYVFNMDDQSPPNSFYLNNGDGSFEKVTSGDVVIDRGASLGCSWGDFDNDGDLDLFVSNMNYQGYKNNMYFNNGNGEFTKATESEIINANGVDNTVCDFDNDGDLDILITDGGAMGASAPNYLYSNNGNENNWINISFRGTISNSSAIGVRVKIKANIFGNDIWQMREITQQNGTFGHSSLRAHFGLGDATMIDSVVAVWPSGNQQILTNVSAKQFLTITEAFEFQHDFTVLPDLENIKSATNFTNFVPEIKIRNIGALDEYNVSVSCVIDTSGAPIYSENIVLNTVSSSEVTKTTFNPVPILTSSHYQIKYFTQLTSDQNVLNDTLTTYFESSNLIDDFENGLTNWDYNCEGTERSSAFKYSGEFGFNIKYEKGIESWAEFTHSFNLSQLSNAYLSFWTRYFLLANKDSACIEISSDGGNNWTQVGNTLTSVLTTWNQHFVDLSNFCGPEFDNIRIRFMIMPNSTTVMPGWYLDDISIQVGSAPTVVASNSAGAVTDFELFENYPNPFNSSTFIRYHVPEASDLKITVYNVMGQKIATLVDRYHKAGNFKVSWDGKDNKGRLMPSGIYFTKLEATGFCDCKKMLLVQ